MTTDPADLTPGYEMGYRAATEAIATWLEECVGRIGLWQRCEIGADLRTGKWKTDARLKGLREKDLQERRGQTLIYRGVKAADMPPEVLAWAVAERDRKVAERRAQHEEVARILHEQYGLDAPPLPDPRPAPKVRTEADVQPIRPRGDR